jgi:hypothetical protein
MRISSLPIVLLLTMVLLSAQWMGVKHRIVHARQASAQTPSSFLAPAMSAVPAAPATPAAAGDIDLTHSCLSFDAATMADAVHAPPFMPLLQASAHVLSLWAAFLSWDAPPSLCFSSRAPPLR